VGGWKGREGGFLRDIRERERERERMDDANKCSFIVMMNETYDKSHEIAEH
jgi:hypothetical protein